MKTLRTCISEFISNATFSVSGLGALAWNIVTTEHEHDSSNEEVNVRGAWLRSASSSSSAGGIAGMRATKLIHEVRNHTMEMKSIVKSFLGKVNEVVGYKELLRKEDENNQPVMGICSVNNSSLKVPKVVSQVAVLFGILRRRRSEGGLFVLLESLLCSLRFSYTSIRPCY